MEKAGEITNIFKQISYWIKKYPQKIALIDGDHTITYELLGKYIRIISNMLIREGIQNEDIVGIRMERSMLSVIATLGVLHAHAAFLPIDTRNSDEWAVYALNKSNAKLMLTDCRDVMISNFNGKVIYIKKCLEDVQKQENEGIQTDIKSDLLAYVIFTSGTTGVSKGVQIEHGGMNNHLMSKIKLLHLDSHSVVAHNASISFDISIWQIAAPLCVGGTVVIFPEKDILNIRKFLTLVQEKKVSVLEVVPSYMIRLMDYSKSEELLLKDLKYIISTGEELRAEVLNRWFQRFDIPVVNAFGPTEASDDILHCVIKKTENIKTVPIGKPIDNIRLYVMKDDTNICEQGEIGELWVSGVCVGRGYIQDKEETNRHFTLDYETGHRLYKTGDLVSVDEKGEYLFHGRRDTQVKIFGQRIEIKQIENAILAYPLIRDVAVVNSNGSIIAFYLSDNTIDSHDLKVYLNHRLPHFMIPKQFVRSEQLAYLLNGKVDYKKLLERNICEKTIDIQKAAENESIESRLLNIIQEITDKKNLSDENGWKEDMSVIGLNSANMIDMVIKIEREFQCEVEDKYLETKFLLSFQEICEFLKTKEK